MAEAVHDGYQRAVRIQLAFEKAAPWHDCVGVVHAAALVGLGVFHQRFDVGGQRLAEFGGRAEFHAHLRGERDPAFEGEEVVQGLHPAGLGGYPTVEAARLLGHEILAGILPEIVIRFLLEADPGEEAARVQILLQRQAAVPPSALLLGEEARVEVVHRGGFIDDIQTVHQPQDHGGDHAGGGHAGEPAEPAVCILAGQKLLHGILPVEFGLEAEFLAEAPGVEGAGEGDGVVALGLELGGDCILQHLPYVDLLKLGDGSVHVLEHGPEFRLEFGLVRPGEQHGRMSLGDGLHGLLHGCRYEDAVRAVGSAFRLEDGLDAKHLGGRDHDLHILGY